jgi:FkbM family methyltransferase
MPGRGSFREPYLALLPVLYRLLLTATRRHGLFTLARFHTRFFRYGQIVRLPGGGKLLVPRDEHFFGFLAGIHEDHIRKTIRETVAAGDVCFDVGANIGYFSSIIAKLVGREGRVVAFEPVPETFEILRSNAALAQESGLTITPIRAAVSSEEGVLSIQRQRFSTQHTVTADRTVCAHASNWVRSRTIDQQIIEAGDRQPVALLKIDVEGHELPVLEGARKAMSGGRIKRMIVEVAPGKDARGIELLLKEYRASVRPWLNDRWCRAALADLPCRTDVLVEFCR